MAKVLLLGYEKCETCRKAKRWLDDHKVPYEWRPIVDEPPTVDELKKWIPAAGLPLKKWLNTSGQSYRALDKDKLGNATDGTLVKWLSQDGKLVKRPVLVGKEVLVGFSPDAYAALFGP